MNIFYTSTDPYQSADDHCIVHQVKMILEYAQLLSTAHHASGTGSADMYKATHVNHPSAVWVRESTANHEWLHTCWYKLLHNFLERTGRPHKSHQTVSAALAQTPPLPDVGLTPVRMAMPDEYRTDDACVSYQRYLNAKFQEWLDRPRPMKVEFMYGEPEWLKLDRYENCYA